MEAYIRGIGNISPQHSWDPTGFPGEIIRYEGNRLKCIEPGYKEFIKPIQMRRMSRTLKMGVAAAGKCLRDAKVEVPDAIVVGTGLGMIADTEKFLRAVIDNGETLLTPTSFIQSTHNTVGAHIAVMLKCNKYNITYVSDYLSFESALLDSMIRIVENPEEKVLLAGIDEMTDTYFTIIENAGMTKHVVGEGASFFVVSGEKHPDNYARFGGVKTFYKPESEEETDDFIIDFLTENGIEISDVDLLISGVNGNLESDGEYRRLHNSLFKNTAIAYYKHLCGEYYTASSFASWMAAMILKTQVLPPEIMLNAIAPPTSIKNILIYNQQHNTRHGLILISAC